MVKTLRCLTCSVPADVEQGDALSPYFRSDSKQCLPRIVSALLFAFLCFLLEILLFEMAPSVALQGCVEGL